MSNIVLIISPSGGGTKSVEGDPGRGLYTSNVKPYSKTTSVSHFRIIPKKRKKKRYKQFRKKTGVIEII